jgi:hypothetical protein
MRPFLSGYLAGYLYKSAASGDLAHNVAELTTRGADLGTAALEKGPGALRALGTYSEYGAHLPRYAGTAANIGSKVWAPIAYGARKALPTVVAADMLYGAGRAVRDPETSVRKFENRTMLGAAPRAGLMNPGQAVEMAGTTGYLGKDLAKQLMSNPNARGRGVVGRGEGYGPAALNAALSGAGEALVKGPSWYEKMLANPSVERVTPYAVPAAGILQALMARTQYGGKAPPAQGRSVPGYRR